MPSVPVMKMIAPDQYELSGYDPNVRHTIHVVGTKTEWKNILEGMRTGVGKYYTYLAWDPHTKRLFNYGDHDRSTTGFFVKDPKLTAALINMMLMACDYQLFKVKGNRR